MQFNSITFLFIFMPISIIGFYCTSFIKSSIKNRMQNIILLILSLVFFAWADLNSVLPIIIIGLTTFLSALLSRTNKKFLFVGVIIDILAYFYFKVLDNLVMYLHNIFSLDLEITSILAPVGLSFLVFHSISYLMDIYHNRVKVNTNIIQVFLYLLFFPKLIQGPIVKYYDMERFLNNKVLSFKSLVHGIERFIIGLVKKVLFADVFALTASNIFSQTYSCMDVVTAWIGVFAFSLQLYLDFSGYSDMAIGLSEIFGLNVKENFNFPFSSTSISDFWRRWHISLGSWFKEYLYIPLGGNRKGNVYFNLFVVFIVTGLWHGSKLTFILWGLAHGCCIVAEKFLSKKGIFQKIPKAIRWVYTMFVVNIGWIVFVVDGMDMFKTYLKNMLGLRDHTSLTFTYQYFLGNKRFIILSIVAILCMLILQNKKVQSLMIKLNKKSKIFNIIKYSCLIILFVICISAVVSSTYSPFLYEQY